MKLTVDQLKKIMPRMERNPKTCAALLPHLQAAMDEAKIDTKERVAAFLAQLAHESGEFRYMEEIWGPTDAQKRYERPIVNGSLQTPATKAPFPLWQKLGNTEPGDGKRFAGHGVIQLTGRANHRAAGKALGVDLEAHPEKAAQPVLAFRIAGYFWTSRSLNNLADKGDIDAVSKVVNGGTNGLHERRDYYKKALAVLSDPATAG